MTRSRSPSTRWPSAASATSRSSRTVGRPGSSPRGTSSITSRPSWTDVPDAPRVLVLADDLIWADRLASGRVRGRWVAGPRRVGGRPCAEALRRRRRRVVIVDLTARAYDGLVAVGARRLPADASSPSGQHDDHELRKRALAAGAERVLAYRKLFEDGPATVGCLPGPRRAATPRVTATRADRSSRPRGSRSAWRAAGGAAAAAGLDALLIGVGSDLRYLTGYEAMPLERLTMLVVPARRATPILVVPRLERGAAEAGPADGRRDPHLGRDRRSVRPGASRAGLDGRAAGRGLRHAARDAPAAPPGGARADDAVRPRVGRPARPADGQGRRRDRPAPPRRPGRRPGRRADRRRAARRPDRGGRGARGPRPAHRRGPRGSPVRDRRLRSELGVAAPRGVRPGRSGPASRSCSTSAGRSAATARTSRGRCG